VDGVEDAEASSLILTAVIAEIKGQVRAETEAGKVGLWAALQFEKCPNLLTVFRRCESEWCANSNQDRSTFT
jgi:hypothetical protein